MPLTQLLIKPSQVQFLKDVEHLMATANQDLIGEWWVKMNQHEYPIDCPNPIPVWLHDDWGQERCAWGQRELFRLLSERLGERLQTLYWRAAGNTTEVKARAARTELAFLKRLATVEAEQPEESE